MVDIEDERPVTGAVMPEGDGALRPVVDETPADVPSSPDETDVDP